MRHRVINFTDRNKDLIAMQCFNTRGTNKKTIEKMKSVLYTAIEFELTDRQKDCLIKYYVEGKKMKQIASELNVTPSTVTRHIKAAKSRLNHLVNYF